MSRMVSPEEYDVQVVPYDARWPGDYTRESPLVARSFGDLVAIEHIGSTAVPGLRAKPIVDILVGDRDESPPSTTVLVALEALGYEFHGEDGRRPGRWFWRKRGATSFNVSRVPFGSEPWKDNLIFRDYLRAHREEAERYAMVKVEAQRRSPTSLLGYQDGKRVFIEELKIRARRWSSEAAQ
jgi:GrpB-like predicted nucleotidyltransferase (UPF0157 family)